MFKKSLITLITLLSLSITACVDEDPLTRDGFAPGVSQNAEAVSGNDQLLVYVRANNINWQEQDRLAVALEYEQDGENYQSTVLFEIEQTSFADNGATLVLQDLQTKNYEVFVFLDRNGDALHQSNEAKTQSQNVDLGSGNQMVRVSF